MGIQGRATVSARDYCAYIQSAEWRAVRRRYWRSRLPKWCYICGADPVPGMHLHHRTYKNLGNERLMDLVPVCPGCHGEIHRLYQTDGRWRRKGLWAVTNYLRRRRGGGARAAIEMSEIYRQKGLTQKRPKSRRVSR